MRIRYRTTRGCDYDDREVDEELATLVDRNNATLGQLVELLVDKGVLTVEEAFSEFKEKWGVDRDLIDD